MATLPPALLADVLAGDRPVRAAAEGIWSVLPEGEPEQRYDGRAAAYDRVVGSRLYNWLMWGSAPADYTAFAARAVASADGAFLDVGCGSLVFTAPAYAATDRPLVLVDRSLGMLRQAQRRLTALHGRMPPHVVLLQGDVLDLPFAPSSFRTVLSMGLLHLFDEAGVLAGALANVLAGDGRLFLTSLVAEGRVGRRYLALLHRSGEVAAPRSPGGLVREVRGGLPRLPERQVDEERRGSMLYLTVSPAAGSPADPAR